MSNDIDVLQSRVIQPKAGVPQASALLPLGSRTACATDKMALPPPAALQISLQERQPFSINGQALIKKCHGCERELVEKATPPPMMSS